MNSDLTKDNLLTRAISGVLTGAQEGELPLFAWTLGMRPDAFVSMVKQCFPELGELDLGSKRQFEQLLNTTPAQFEQLVHLMLRYRQDGFNNPASEWLARTIAAACFGSHHLWEDLGLFDRQDVTTLLTEHFPGLVARNVNEMRWKRFLFHELGINQGGLALRPPGCQQCEDYRLCFEADSTSNVSLHDCIQQ
jgi:nitrogen fixation protein NifQ